MLSDIMEADATLYTSSALVAGLLTLSFYFLSLFSVYQRNEEYSQQKARANQQIAKQHACEEATMVAAKNESDTIEHALASGAKLSTVSTNYIDEDETNESDTNTLRNRTAKSGTITKDMNQDSLGSISLERLHTFDCHNESRRVISLLGHLFDVTDCAQYAKDGDRATLTGHDITLCMATYNFNVKWLDRFVQMKHDFKETAAQALEEYTKMFRSVGKLDKWATDRRKWTRLTAEELDSLNMSE